MGARQTTTGQRRWHRYIALGDSFTEEMCDPDGLQYANLAVRGRLLPEILTEQLPAALDTGADLVSLVGGGNDVLRPAGDPDRLAALLEGAVVRLRSTGATVLLATGGGSAAAPRWTRRRPVDGVRCCGTTPSGFAAMSRRGWHAGCAAGPPATP